MVAKMKSLSGRPTSRHTGEVSPEQEILLKRKTDLPRNFFTGKNDLLGQVTVNEKGSNLYRRKTDSEHCSELSDIELIAIIREQNKELYRELFFRYQKRLLVYISHLIGSREDAEDILQNVFSKTYKSIESFDMDRKFSSWIYRIAHNEAINYIKRKNKRYLVSWEDVTTSKDKLEMATDDEPLEDRLFQQEIVTEIDEAMVKLPSRYQKVLKLRYFEEKSYEEIAKIIRKPINTVGTLISRAKKKLLEIVKKMEAEDENKKSPH